MRKAAVLLYSLTLAHGLSFPWSAKNDARKEGRRCTLDVLVIDKANHIFRFNIKHPSGGSQRVGGYTDDNTHRIRKRDINYEGAVQRPMPGNVVDAQTGVGYGGALDGSSNEVHKPQKVPGDGFNTERESYGVGNREYSEKQQFAPGGPANETPSVENEPVSERAMDPRYRGSEGYDRGGYEGRDSPPPRYQGYQEYPPQDRSYGAVPRGDQRYRREQYGNESERRDQYPIHNPQDDRQYPSTRQDDAETVRLVFKASQDWDEVSVPNDSVMKGIIRDSDIYSYSTPQNENLKGVFQAKRSVSQIMNQMVQNLGKWGNKQGGKLEGRISIFKGVKRLEVRKPGTDNEVEYWANCL